MDAVPIGFLKLTMVALEATIQSLRVRAAK
jgi:hypothetical protein